MLLRKYMDRYMYALIPLLLRVYEPGSAMRFNLYIDLNLVIFIFCIVSQVTPLKGGACETSATYVLPVAQEHNKGDFHHNHVAVAILVHSTAPFHCTIPSNKDAPIKDRETVKGSNTSNIMI